MICLKFLIFKKLKNPILATSPVQKIAFDTLVFILGLAVSHPQSVSHAGANFGNT